MPTLADMEAAQPKCPRDGEPLVYFDEENTWFCPVHGCERSGAEVAAEGLTWRETV